MTVSRHREDSTASNAVSCSNTYRKYLFSPSGEATTDEVLVADLGDHVESISSKSMDDFVIPNFYKRSKQGMIFNNPMHSTVTETKDKIVNYDQSWGSYSYDGDGVRYHSSHHEYISPLPCPSSLFLPQNMLELDSSSINIEALKSKAVAQAHANCDLSDVSVVATAGEMRETVLGIANVLRRVYKISKAIKRLDIRALRGEVSPKELKDRYMEARYGLRPLYYDVLGHLKLFNDSAHKEPRQTFRGYASDSADTDFSGYYMYSSDRRVDYVHRVTRAVEVRAGVLCAIESLTMANRIGARNIAQGAWELIPLSFVLDWFLNIGDVIASFCPKAGLRELASWLVVTDTTITDTTGIIRVVPNDPDSYRTLTCDDLHVYSSTTSRYRTPNPPRGILPTFDVRLDFMKGLDLGIILNNIRKQVRR